MEVKANVVIEIVKEERRYSFSMPVGAPFGQVRDVAVEVLQQVIAMMRESDQKLEENMQKAKEGE